MTLHPLLPDSPEERTRRGVLFRRFANCPNCDAPAYDKAIPPIRFVPTRPSRWKPL